MSIFRRGLMTQVIGEQTLPDYLCFTALEDGTFSFTIGSSVSTGGSTGSGVTYVEYSIDNGQTWTKTTHESKTTTIITTPLIITGNTVLWRGSAKSFGLNNGFTLVLRCYFSSTGNFNVSGKIASLLSPNEQIFELTTLVSTNYLFPYLFWNCTGLIDASDLILVSAGATSTTIGYGYYHFFHGCTSLVSVPTISNIAITTNIFNGMFYGCTSLVVPPVLPSGTLKGSCFKEMFYNCTSLTSVPKLPATNTASYCYSSMFSGCTSLTTANIDLPGQTLYLYCYLYMFSSCSNLTSAPRILATSLNLSYCCRSMFASCSKLTTVAAMPNVTTISSTACVSMYEKCPLIKTSIDFTNITVSSKQGSMFTRCGLTSIPGSHILQHIGSNMFSYNSLLPAFVDFRNVLYSSSHFNTNTGIRNIFLPKFIAADGQYSFTAVTILDIGKNCTSLGTTNVFYGTVSTLILRSTTPPTLTSWSHVPPKVYVPADAVSTYQNESIYSSLNIYAIGGTEWLELFSSASDPTSEYADVEIYVPSELLNIYISLYEE